MPCHKSGQSAHYKANREAHGVSTRAWAEANPDKKEEIGERSRLKRYGLTLDQYQALLLEQNGSCGICGVSFGTVIHIDHDHRTGLVRGLLCHTCNVGLGHFKDDPDLLREAANYLGKSERYSEVNRKPKTFRTDDRRCKVTEDMCAEMASLRRDGLSFGKIAKQVGLSRAWVYLTLKAYEGRTLSTTI